MTLIRHGRSATAKGLLAFAFLTSLAATSAAQPYRLGISASANEYGTRAFANMLAIDARVWSPGTSNLGPVDGNGYPTTDFDLFVLDGGFAAGQNLNGFNGTYRLSFTGQATVTANGGTLSPPTYNSGTNTTTATLVVTQTHPTISFTFRNTRRTSGSPLGSGVTGMKLMRPTTIGSATPYSESTVFTTEYLAVHNRGTVIRSMDFVGTNGNIQASWGDRQLPGNLNYFSGTGYGWQGKGAPWEHFILLCNTLDKDAWVNVPLYATDSYVQQLAAMLKAQLEPGRKVFVEWSNEIWNFSFAQFGQVSGLAQSEIQSNPSSTLNFDGACTPGGSYDSGIAVPRYWARRSMQISNIFRTEFGDAAMHDGTSPRVFPLFQTQADWHHWISNGLNYLDRYYNNADGNHVGTPRPPARFFWGGGGSGYIHGFPAAIANNAGATVNDIFTGYGQSWTNHYNTMAGNAHWCAAFGMKRVAYESGPGEIHGAAENAVRAAQTDSRIKDVWKRCVDEFYKAGGELYMQFLGVNVVHGLQPYDAVVGSQVTYKRQAFDELVALANRPAPTVGTAVPGNINGGRFNVHSDGYSTGTTDNPLNFGSSGYTWASYTIRSTTAQNATVRLTASASSGGQAKVYINGQPAGTVTLTAGVASAPLTAAIPQGVSGIRIQRVAGSFSLQTVAVTTGGSTGTGTGLRGQYFNNKTLTAPIALTRTEAVDFSLWAGSPGTVVNADNFSVRWEGEVEAPTTGSYTFATTSDDGVRLWVNNVQVINNWTDHAATTNTSGAIALTAGQKYAIKMEFYEATGNATARLLWTPPGGSQEAVPADRLYPATGGGGTGPNLIVNPGFEGSVAGNWMGGGTYGTTTTNPRTGTYAGSVGGGWSSQFQTVSGLTPNTQYTLTAYCRANSTPGTNVNMYVTINGVTTRVNITSTSWQQYTITFNTGSATSIQVGCGEINGSSVTTNSDDWSLTQG
ncbi:MAG: PA14 domain-containing protein [Fimbriimonas sp.]